MLFANHEYTNETIMFPAIHARRRRPRGGGQAAHGLSVVELERKNKNQPWTYVQGAELNRRYLNSTVYELTGPAAGSALVKTTDDPDGRWIKGTLGNCAGGTTPWGTILSGEENFNGYFVAPGHLRRGQALRPDRQGHGPPVGTGRSALRHPQRRLRERGQPLRLDRGSGPVRPHLHAEEALLAGPLQARGRQRDRGRSPGTWWPTPATTSASTTSTSSSPRPSTARATASTT